MKIWTCKIGEAAQVLGAADVPMRRAVEAAYRDVTGAEPEFLFSGWGGKLDECERAVVERRLPDPIKDVPQAFEAIKTAMPEPDATVEGVPLYMADSLRDYALERVAAERERCRKILFQGGAPRSETYGDWAPVSARKEREMSERTKAVGAPLERQVRPSVVDGDKFASQHFRLRKGENICGDRTIWLDLNGSSYVPAATDRRSATAMARQLRLAADWLDMQKPHTFRKRSKA